VGATFRRSVSRATSVSVEDKTIVPEERTIVREVEIKEEDEDDDDDTPDGTTVMRTVVEGTVVDEDSLVDDLLSDAE